MTPGVRDTFKILWKRGEIAPLPFSTIFSYLLLDLHIKTGTRCLLRDRRLSEFSKERESTVNNNKKDLEPEKVRKKIA